MRNYFKKHKFITALSLCLLLFLLIGATISKYYALIQLDEFALNISIATPTEISITTAPNLVNYVAGMNFDKSGMEVVVSYSDGSTRTLTADEYTILNGENLVANQTEVTVSYTGENDVTVTAPVTISVASDYTAFTVTSSNRSMAGYTGAENEELVIPAIFQGAVAYDADGDGVEEPAGTWYKVVGIGDNAFSVCNSLKSVEIPGSVSVINSNAFSWDGSLKTVLIHEGTTTIGSQAFAGCYSLESITLPSSITSIASNALDSPASWAIPNADGNWYSASTGTGYTKETIPTGVADIYYASQSLLPNTIHEITITGNNRELIGYTDETTELVIPETFVSTIAYDADYDGFEEPAGTKYKVTSIGSYAFSNSTNLTSVTIPNSVTSIQDAAFYGSGLKSIEIPGSVSVIGGSVFYGCLYLESITLPSSITSIAYDVFSHCESLESIMFEGTVEQWNAITFGEGWNSNVPATEVICSDGTVSLS